MHKVLRALVAEFSNVPTRDEVLVMLVRYQAAVIGCTIDSPTFTLDAQEVLAMQEGADALGSEDTAVQMKAADAIVARAGASGHPDMGLGYAPVTSPLRLALTVIRLHCALLSKAPLAGPNAMWPSLQELLAKVTDVAVSAAAGGRVDKEESKMDLADVEEGKRAKNEAFALQLSIELEKAGEVPLARCDMIQNKILKALYKRLVLEKRCPDLEDGGEDLGPNTMHPCHAEFYGQEHAVGEVEAPYLSSTGSYRMRTKMTKMTFKTPAEYARVVRRFIMNIWYVTHAQRDVPGKSPGPHKIGARMEGGRETIVFSPRAVFEALCHTITQLAALCGTDLDQFDYFVVATWMNVSEDANVPVGGLTLGASINKAMGTLIQLIRSAQVAKALPYRAPLESTYGGVGTPMTGSQLTAGAGAMQPLYMGTGYGAPPPYVPPQNQQMTQLYQAVKSGPPTSRVRNRGGRAAKGGVVAGKGGISGSQQMASVVAGALTYGNSGPAVAFQQGGGAAQGGKGRDAATGKWLALAGGNPDNPDPCGYIKHTKGHVCWKNHFAK